MCPLSSIRESNDAIFAENARRVEDKMQVDELPPLPREQEDEKMCDTTPESLPDTATLSIQ